MPSSCWGRRVTERLTIASIGHRGDGVVDTPDGAVYVPFTLPGETVEVDGWPGHPDRRHLLRVETASADRTAPICPHFGACGGCAIQHWRSERYRTWKRRLVSTALAQVDVPDAIGELVDAHGRGRRRATLHARRGTHDVLQVGFAAPRAHHIVAIDQCPILAPELAGTIKTAWAVAEALGPVGRPLDIQVTATDNGLDVDVRGSGALAPARISALARVADLHRLARLTRHGELIALRAAPTLSVGRAKVTLPPGAFLQATEAGEAALAEQVVTHVGTAKSIADLFAGVGPFALRLAERARVMAADSDEPAIAALKSAAAAPGLKPIEAVRRDLFRRPLVAAELKPYDAVVFDPPRQGAQAQATQLAASKVPVVVAVSCNVVTFARDARILIDGGYKIEGVTPVDQFRHTPHVELVARFVR
jgi:23S rRNA (uracil1939-C5)-methyltransferase